MRNENLFLFIHSCVCGFYFTAPPHFHFLFSAGKIKETHTYRLYYILISIFQHFPFNHYSNFPTPDAVRRVKSFVSLVAIASVTYYTYLCVYASAIRQSASHSFTQLLLLLYMNQPVRQSVSQLAIDWTMRMRVKFWKWNSCGNFYLYRGHTKLCRYW